MDRQASQELLAALRDANGDQLELLVAEHLGELDPVAIRQILQNPFVSGEVVETLLRRGDLLSFYEVRRALSAHPRTPRIHALRFVPGLYWRDLMTTAADVRVPPAVRRAAEICLVDRLSSMAVGEKVSLARRASPAVVAGLRRDPSTHVIEALLENPRLTEGVLLPLANDERARPQVLEVLARNPRWGVRYPIRVALCRNPRTPARSALPLMPHLRKVDLRAVASDMRLAWPVRRRAKVLLGDVD